MKDNKRIIHVLIAISILFVMLVGYLTVFSIAQSPKYVKSQYNRRPQVIEENILRGKIFDRNGTVLAESQINGGKQSRIYPFGSMYSHVLGYNSKIYGRSLLELQYNDYLLGRDSFSSVINALNKLKSNEKIGNNLYLTIDHKLQTLGESLFKGKKGAIVAMNPKTGEVLAMVSGPEFDPNEKSLEANWKDMTESQDSPFLPRATQGLYAPGSTFKVVTTALAIENGLEDKEFNDNGSVVINGKKVSNAGGHVYGHLNLTQALTVSSNVVFSQLGVMLGQDKLKDMSGKIGMGKSIPFDIPVSKSLFPYVAMGKSDMGAVGMGQGKIMVSPIHMAMIASAIANKGVMMKPFLVSHIDSNKGDSVEKTKPTELYTIMQEDTARKVTEMMKKVVESGTGTNGTIEGISVAGKTGTAENELSVTQGNKEHAWFISFAPADDPKIAVAVVIEYGGYSGGAISAPIAQKIMAQYLGK